MNAIFQPRNPIQWQWIDFSGADAQDFLHRLTTIDVKALQVGQGAKGFFLSAQGKARAYFTLWNYAPLHYGLELDAGASGRWKTELLSAIEQFHFAEKFEVTDITDLECHWVFPEPAHPALVGLIAHRTGAVEDGVRLCHQGTIDFGRDWITAWGRPGQVQAWIAKNFAGAKLPSFSEVEAWRIAATRPWIDSEITENTIPLEVGLVDAISQNKGCYPGQEVIERIISMGSPARRLARIEGTGPLPAIDTPVMNVAESPAEVGKITSAARLGQGDRFEALAFVRKVHAKEGLEVRIGESGRGRIAFVAPFGEAK